MRRYELLDSDEYRLPEGMQRIGYDADTQVYTFRDADGSIWESAPGNQYGMLHRQGQEPYREPPVTARQRYEAWRYMAPFLLIACVVLFLLFKLLDSPSTSSTQCDAGFEGYTIKTGDTCFEIAKQYSMSLDELQDANHGLECDRLAVGRRICVTGTHTE